MTSDCFPNLQNAPNLTFARLNASKIPVSNGARHAYVTENRNIIDQGGVRFNDVKRDEIQDQVHNRLPLPPPPPSLRLPNNSNLNYTLPSLPFFPPFSLPPLPLLVPSPQQYLKVEKREQARGKANNHGLNGQIFPFHASQIPMYPSSHEHDHRIPSPRYSPGDLLHSMPYSEILSPHSSEPASPRFHNLEHPSPTLDLPVPFYTPLQPLLPETKKQNMEKVANENMKKQIPNPSRYTTKEGGVLHQKPNRRHSIAVASNPIALPTANAKYKFPEPCQMCGKQYRTIACLRKHLWEHHSLWDYTMTLTETKHQSVQLLEAAATLVAMHKEASPSPPLVSTKKTSNIATSSIIASEEQELDNGEAEDTMRTAAIIFHLKYNAERRMSAPTVMSHEVAPMIPAPAQSVHNSLPKSPAYASSMQNLLAALPAIETNQRFKSIGTPEILPHIPEEAMTDLSAE